MEEKKKSNVVPILIVIIILLVVALGTSLALLFLNTETTKEKPTPKPQQEVKLEKVDLDSDLVKEAATFIPNNLCGGTALNLEKKDLDISDISNLDKLNMFISLFEDRIIKTAADQSKVTIKEADLDRYFADLSFMDEFKPAIDTAKPTHNGAKMIDGIIYPLYMKYENGEYSVEGYGTGCTAPGNDDYYLTLVGAEKSNKQLVLTYVKYYSKATFDESTGNFSYEWYKDKESTEKVEVVDGEKIGDYIPDKTKYDNYQIIFDIKDDNLRLTSIKYMK